jgi:hypothetical protein
MSGVVMTPLPRLALLLSAASLSAAAGFFVPAAFAAPPSSPSATLPAHPVPGASGQGAAPRPEAGGPRWNELTPEQRRVLAPLSGDWNSIDDRGKERWLGVAGRFPKMPPEEQQRANQRMVEWSHMTPQQRTQARLNFQDSRGVSKEERQARWQAYQALPEEQKRELAKRATATAAAGSAAAGPASAPHHRHSTPVEVVQPKTNVVGPVKETRTPVDPGSVALEVRPGATTTLLNRKAAPPAHQKDGQPKIAAGPNAVDRTTLLPKRGPQAAVSSAQSSQPAQR